MSNVWGTHLWNSIHFIALGYPTEPTESDRHYYKQFFENIGHVLPCKKCTVHFNNNLQALPIDQYLTNSDTLFDWTVKMHNLVNSDLGKPLWSTENAKQHYSKLINDVVPKKTVKIHIDRLLLAITFLNIVMLLFVILSKK